MKKLLIQVVSVITLVFGTSYQSVLALADDRSRTELSEVQLSDAQGNRARQVKVNETNNLEMTVTVNNKDGENADGKADMWLPEDQLKVMQEQVKAESAVTDTNATLIFERRKNKQPQLEWKNVETSATFKLKVPVQFTAPMTSMILPIALGSQREHLQPLAVVSENATEEEMKEAGTPTELPANMVQSLTSFIDAQQAQEAQQAQQAQQEAQDKEDAQQPEQNAESEAPAKDANEDKAKEDKAKEDAAKEEAEAKREAEAKAKQEAEDKKKEDEKTADTLKKNARTANAESEKDGVERESNDKKETRAGTNLNTILQNNTGEGALSKSLFDSITLKQPNKNPISLTDDNANVSELGDFTLTYEWQSAKLLEKLGTHAVQEGDYYTFRIYGVSDAADSEGPTGDITDTNGNKYAEWELSYKAKGNDDPAANGRAFQEIKVIFTNETMNDTNVHYNMSFDHKYNGSEPIEFEFSEEATITVDPVQTEDLLAKSGKFIGGNEIRWTVTLRHNSSQGATKYFKDITLTDTLQLANNQQHSFTDWNVYYSNDKTKDSLKDEFEGWSEDPSKTSQELTSTSDREVEGSLTFEFTTAYEKGAIGKFANKVGGSFGENVNLEDAYADVTNSQITKAYDKYDPIEGLYYWNATIMIDMSQYATLEQKREALKTMKITDTLKGTHIFDENLLDLKITNIGKDTDVTESFEEVDITDMNKVMTIDTKNDNASLDALIAMLEKTGNDQKLYLSYRTKEDGEGQLNNVNNTISLSLNDGSQDSGEIGGHGGQLITKSGELDRTVHEGEDAFINWSMTVNQAGRTFNTLKVIDVLPDDVKTDDIEYVEVKGERIDLNNLDSHGIKGLTIKRGMATQNRTNDKTLFNFDENGTTGNQALQFEFDGGYLSGEEISIKIQTKHEWNSKEHLNRVGAVINNQRHEYADASVSFDPDYVRDGHKGGELKLTDNPESKDNTVEWSVGIGSRLNTYFSAKAGDVNEITVKDTLNRGGIKYLSFLPDDAEDSPYKLYALNKDGKDPQPISKDHYVLTFNEDDPEEATIKITFTEKAPEKTYSYLSLQFETPIDLKAWNEANKGDEDVSLPDSHEFLNDVAVSFGSKEAFKDEAQASLTTTGIYGQKQHGAVKDNKIEWNAILNATSMNIGKPVITDKLTGDHIHGVAPDDLEISLVDVKHTEKDGKYNVEVDESGRTEVLEYGKDYTVKQYPDEMIITFEREVKRPIHLNYKTTMTGKSNSYGNGVTIQANGHNTGYSDSYEITSGAFIESWGVRFLKMDADANKPLPGATFKLQQSRKGSGVWTDAVGMDGKKIEPVTSNEEGFLQFYMLGTLLEYRIVEVGVPENDKDSQLAEFVFDKDRHDAENWQNHNPKINNHDVPTGGLTIRKDVEKIASSKEFDFEVRALDENGNVDTSFNGTYDLYGSSGQVKFVDGISQKITVPGADSRTIEKLPIEKVAADGSKSPWYYQVSEVNREDGYATQVSVNGGEYQNAYTTEKFELEENNASPVRVRFLNTADLGDLEVRKTVSGGSQADNNKKYNFTVEAANDDSKTAVKGNRYDAEGALRTVQFDSEGKVNFELSDQEYVYIKNLPKGTKLKVTEEKPEANNLETTWSINGGEYGNGDNSVIINSNEPQYVYYKNSFSKSGQINLMKKISSSVSANEQFKFEIETDDTVNGKYPFAKYNAQGGIDSTGTLEFKNGKTDISLKGNEHVIITELPLNTEFTITEAETGDSHIETSWEAGSQSGKGSVTDPVKLDDANDMHNVTFTNALPNGSLTLNKKVLNQLPGDNVTPFTFTITGVNDDDVNKVKNRTFTVDGNNGMDDIDFNDKGQATLSLTHDQSVKILGLPAGVHLRITEDNHPDFNATYNIGGGEEDEDADGPTVTVPDDKNVSVNYTNTRPKSGSLLLEKQAEGSYPTGDAIGFTIEALDANKDLDDEFSATLRQTDGTTLNKKVEFNGGKADVSIKPGEKLEVKNLPLGEYKVTEDDQEDSVITTWKVDNNDGTGLVADDATVKENDTTHVLFTNKIANGSLELNKKVLNPLPGDQDTEFTFTIQAADDDIGKVADETYDVETNFNGRDHVKFNDEGQATLKLSHNQSVKVLGLPAGVQLKISEEQHSDFNVSYTVNGDEDDDEDGPTVTIPDGKNVAVNYTNARPIYGSLMLQKRAEGSYPTDKGIKFTIKALDENQDLERKFDATLTHTNGTTTSQKVSFENGEAEVTILPGEQLLIQNLPTGQYQVTEERQNRLVTTTWDIGTTQGNREKAAPVTVGEGDTAHVRFTNKIATGKLELNKFVASHDDADKDKDYKFELRASRSTRWMVANKSYDVSGHSETKRIEFDRSGRAEISLKDGQTINVSDLPEGVRLAVIETDSNDLKATWNVNSEGSYEELSQRNRPNVTITEDQTEVVSYRNVRDPVGSLRVDKIVKGAYTDDHRKFEFTVDAQKIADKDSNDADTEDADDTDEWITNEEFNGKYNVKVYSRSNNELQENSEVEFTNGQATLELKADQYAVIEGLPLNDDEQFQVSETDPDIANMMTTWAKNNGSPEEGLVAEPVTLDETDVPRITFTNSLETGNLVLDKKLSGEISDTDRNRAFEFTVDAQVEDTETGEWKTDEAFTGDYTATKTTADGRQTTSNVTFENGQLTVALKGGERLQISNLPANMHMVVSETPDGDYETSHQINHGSEMLGTTNDPITIQNGSDQAVTFINDRPAQPQTAWLSLTKSVIGENGERDRGFEFNIRFLDDQMNPLTGTVDVVMTTPLGEHITSQMMLDMDGSSSFALMDGETIRWQVPNGTHYQITESDYSADGYQTSVSQGQAPEREGLTATGVVMTNDPGSAKVVYYNRADPTPEDEPHTPEEPDTTVPGFVPPASEPGTGIGTDTEDTLGGSGTLGTGGSTAPQAHTSGTSGSGTAAKGFLPQTGEWMKQNWLLLLGLVILLGTIGLMVRAKRKKG